jgi:aminopeptidase N
VVVVLAGAALWMVARRPAQQQSATSLARSQTAAPPTATRSPADPRPGAAGIGDPYYPDAGNGGYDVRSYRLELRYDPRSDQLDGHAVIDAVATQDLSRLDLDFGPLTVTGLTVNGAAARSAPAGTSELQVTPATGIAAGDPVEVDVRYGGKPGGAGLDHGFHRTADGAFVAGEPESAIDWFPSDDHPRDKATYDFAITVPAGLTAVANGVLQGRTTAGDWTTWRWREGAPMATYLATMAIGNFRVTTGTAAGVPLYSAVASAVPAQQADEAIGRTGPIIEYLASVFGPYPFDAVGGIVVDAPKLGFALETQTRPVYSPAFFTEGSLLGKTAVIAHELTHQWFGDSVSLHDWRDIWLNEGFATYGQWLWTEHSGATSAQSAFEQTYQHISADAWRTPPGDPGVANLFGESVYNRGALTLHALRLTVGDDAFFKILREWAASMRHGNGTSAQFIALAGKVSGKSLDAFFAAWLYGKVKPPLPGR